MLNDNMKIEGLLKVGYMLKIAKLLIILCNMSYFVGMIFLIIADVCRATNDSFETLDQDKEFFLDFYDIDSQDPQYTTIVAFYFALTSLSTVGFGDYNPRSDFERLFVSVMLVGGVAIFSFLMGIFIEILHGYEEIAADIEDYQNLSDFIGMLKYFNKGAHVKMTYEIE